MDYNAYYFIDRGQHVVCNSVQLERYGLVPTDTAVTNLNAECPLLAECSLASLDQLGRTLQNPELQFLSLAMSRTMFLPVEAVHAYIAYRHRESDFLSRATALRSSSAVPQDMFHEEVTDSEFAPPRSYSSAALPSRRL